MLNMHCSLNSIDETEISSIFGLLGYLDRKENKTDKAAVITLGGHKYRRVTADSATWL